MAGYTVRRVGEILKTTTIYPDGKTQVPKKVIDRLKLRPGSQLVWILEGERIYVDGPQR